MIDETEEVITTDDNQDYIDTINQLKSNSVSKDDYNKVKAENKRLLEALANNQQINQSVIQEPVDKDKLRADMFSGDLDNLSYAKTILKLREAIIEEGGNDPFVAVGQKVIPTGEDYECAERVARVMQECIEYADGDSQLFTQELNRRTIDNSTRPSNKQSIRRK